MRAHVASLGLRASDLANPQLLSDTTDAKSGRTNLIFGQRVNGLQVANASLNISLSGDHRVTSVTSSFVAIKSQPASKPILSAAQALSRAASALGLTLHNPPVVKSVQGMERVTTMICPDASSDPIVARLVYLAAAKGLKLGWQMTLRPKAANRYQVTLDSTSGANLGRAAIASTSAADALPTPSPGSPDLAVSSDSDASSSDNITNFNNSSPASALLFNIANTLSGAAVTLYANGVAVASTTASGNTTTIVTDGSTVFVDGDYLFTARETSPGQAESTDSAALTVTVDTAAPSATATTPPVTTPGAASYSFTVQFDDSKNVDWSSFGNANVTVTGPGGFSHLAGLVGMSTDGNGPSITATYRITPPGGTWDYTDNGTYAILLNSGQVHDIAGNSAAAGTLTTFQLSIPPLAPDLLPASDSGLSSSDNVTNFNNGSITRGLQFSAAGITPGATVNIYVDGKLAGSGLAGGVLSTTGTWTIADGIHQVTVRQVVAGVESPDSPAIAVTIDTVAPPPPVPSLESGSDTGASNADRITSSLTPTFDAPVAEAQTVYLQVDDQPAVSVQMSGPGVAKLTVPTPPVTYLPPAIYAAAGNPAGIRTADFNGDGKQDIAFSDLTSGDVYILYGRGDGTFDHAQIVPNINASGFEVADLNGDGRADFVIHDAVWTFYVALAHPEPGAIYSRCGSWRWRRDLQAANHAALSRQLGRLWHHLWRL